MTDEDKMMFMFTTIHEEESPTSSCSYQVKIDPDDQYTPIGISVMKGGQECWWKSKADILFDYLTRRM